ncbi:MAG: GNAT family N-acetyltransferase [Parvularculaceae bacterium]
MPEITLIDATFELIDAACRGDDALAAALGAEIAAGWLEFPEALDMMRGDYENSPAARRWGTLFFVAGSPRRLIGWGGYKGAPKDGAVEIGYAIAPGERGKGYATAAAQAMVARAFAAPEISAVTAHTLAEENASTSVLKKTGFDKVSDFIDPEDGPVWGWRLERAVAERRPEN